MTKFICTALVLACVAIVAVNGQYKTSVKCTSLNDCICQLPWIIGAVKGRTAKASIQASASSDPITVDLSQQAKSVEDYCAQVRQGKQPSALPVFNKPPAPVNTAKLAQVQQLLAARG
ncbi:uncharacterized protein LOC128271665 [Anopheles cruzii]|uniref:uncharacterized protein LOC128271665 n=1 Tax=Anopheles cruzii TaxID=68878 RepID=UPI0022EC37E4|nr:uncharacterized protein LOC128271665 [Anopheles cruzii]